MADDNLTAALTWMRAAASRDDAARLIAAVRIGKEYGWFDTADCNPEQAVSDLTTIAEGFPRLLGAIDEVLKLADDWDAGGANRPGLDRQFIAAKIREAISRPLTGKEPRP